MRLPFFFPPRAGGAFPPYAQVRNWFSSLPLFSPPKVSELFSPPLLKKLHGFCRNPLYANRTTHVLFLFTPPSFLFPPPPHRREGRRGTSFPPFFNQITLTFPFLSKDTFEKDGVRHAFPPFLFPPKGGRRRPFCGILSRPAGFFRMRWSANLKNTSPSLLVPPFSFFFHVHRGEVT